MAIPVYPFEMNYQKARLSSFSFLSQDVPVSALQLCDVGFYYDRTEDELQCYSCHLKIKMNVWPRNSDPLSTHLRNSPQCPYINNNAIDNIPLACDTPQPFTAANQLKGNFTLKSPSQHNQLKHTDTSEVDASPEAISNLSASLYDHSSQLPRDSFARASASGSLATSTTHIPKPKEGNSTRTHHLSGNTSNQFPNPEQRNLASAPPAQNFASTVPLESQGNVKSTNLSEQTDLRYERGRLQTFRNWPSNAAVRPEVLAKCGFYYTGSDDRVQCAFCRGILRNWEAGDEVDAEHRRHFGQCPFLSNPFGVGNVTIEDESTGVVNINDPIQQNYCQGIVTEKPVHQRYSLPSDRLATYRDFPTNMMQTPELFTRAGFFYSGIADNVKCFFCDGGLRNWEPNDDPWTEHARWFPRCGFLRLCKGDEYIKEVQERFNPSHQYRPSRRRKTLKHKQPVDPNQLLKNLRTTLVKSVLEMGCDEQKVKEVVKRRLQELGDDFFPNTESLFDAISEYEDELKYIEAHGEEENSNDDDNSNEELTVTNALENDLNKYPEQTSEAKKSKRKRKKKKKNVSEKNQVEKNTLECLTQDDANRLEEDVQKLKDERTCKVCMDEEVNVVFLKCGHLVCCANCAPAMRHCPICREQIRGTVRVFLS